MKIINRLGVIIIAGCTVFLILACASQVMTKGGDKIYTYTSSPSDQDNYSYAQFSIWCPGNIEKYKGIIYLGAGYEHSSIPMMNEKKWQNLARENEFVILTSTMKSRTEKDYGILYWQAEYGTGQAMINAIKHFAEVSSHPEVEDAPLAMWGFSAGGQFNYHFTCWKPERVITFVAIKGGYYVSEPDKEALKVPALWFTGQNDKQRRIDAINKIFNDNIKDNPRWCLANEAASGHVIGQTDELVFPWLKEIIRQRVPEKTNQSNQILVDIDINKTMAWLGDRRDGYIAPLSYYERDRKNSSWLPNEEVAKVWKEFHAYK